MINIAATHNFVLEEGVKWLKLQTSKEVGWLKVINFAAKRSNGIACGVIMKIGTQEGKVNLTVAPMDDLKMVLGMDFLHRVKAVPLSFLCSIVILEEMTPCMVLQSLKARQILLYFQQCN